MCKDTKLMITAQQNLCDVAPFKLTIMNFIKLLGGMHDLF